MLNGDWIEFAGTGEAPIFDDWPTLNLASVPADDTDAEASAPAHIRPRAKRPPAKRRNAEERRLDETRRLREGARYFFTHEPTTLAAFRAAARIQLVQSANGPGVKKGRVAYEDAAKRRRNALSDALSASVAAAAFSPDASTPNDMDADGDDATNASAGVGVHTPTTADYSGADASSSDSSEARVAAAPDPHWRDQPKFSEFKGIGLSPKKDTPRSRVQGSSQPVIDSLLRCVSLGMGAFFTKCDPACVEIYVNDTGRLLRAVAYSHRNDSGQVSDAARLKTLRRWFTGIPRIIQADAGSEDKRPRYLMRSRREYDGDTVIRAVRLCEMVRQLQLAVKLHSAPRGVEFAAD